MSASISIKDGLVLLRRPAAPQRQLDAGADQRDRRAQLVAGVVDEAPLVLERLLQRRQHLVQRVPEPGDLVVAVRGDVEPDAGRPGGDVVGLSAVPLDGPQRRLGQPVADDSGHDQGRAGRRGRAGRAARAAPRRAGSRGTATTRTAAGPRGSFSGIGVDPKRARSLVGQAARRCPRDGCRQGRAATCRSTSGRPGHRARRCR